MVEIAACGDEGLTKWCVLQSEDYTMDGTERGEVEVRLQWKHDKKYRRSLAGMMAGMTGLFSGSSQKGDDAPQVKKQPPKKVLKEAPKKHVQLRQACVAVIGQSHARCRIAHATARADPAAEMWA